jgi:hypothetical protein
VHEGEQVAIDVADEERHRLAAPGQQHLAVGIGEHQHGAAVGIGAIAGLQLAGQHVDGAQRPDRPIRGGVVATVDVGGPPGESAAAELVVLEPVEVGVQSLRRLALAQVDE